MQLNHLISSAALFVASLAQAATCAPDSPPRPNAPQGHVAKATVEMLKETLTGGYKVERVCKVDFDVSVLAPGEGGCLILPSKASCDTQVDGQTVRLIIEEYGSVREFPIFSGEASKPLTRFSADFRAENIGPDGHNTTPFQPNISQTTDFLSAASPLTLVQRFRDLASPHAVAFSASVLIAD